MVAGRSGEFCKATLPLVKEIKYSRAKLTLSSATASRLRFRMLLPVVVDNALHVLDRTLPANRLDDSAIGVILVDLLLLLLSTTAIYQHLVDGETLLLLLLLLMQLELLELLLQLLLLLRRIAAAAAAAILAACYVVGENRRCRRSDRRRSSEEHGRLCDRRGGVGRRWFREDISGKQNTVTRGGRQTAH